MKKKLVVFFCVSAMMIAMMAGVLAGCKKEEPAGMTPVILNEVAHSIFYAPMYVAIELGYFKEEGIDLTLVTGFGADKTMTALLTGEADIGFMGPETTVYTYQQEMDDYAVNFAQLTQRAGNFLVARQENDAFSWDDIKGTTVLGGRAGGMPQMVFEYVLKKHNIDPKADLTIDQSIDFGSTAAAFSGGQGDYTVEFEPHATALEVKSDGYVVASIGEESGYVPYTAFSARKSYMEANPSIILSFTNALQKGMDYVNSHTAEEVAKVILPQFEGTKEEDAAKIIERYQEQDTWKDTLVFEEDAFVLLQDILRDAGQLKETVPYEKLVTTEYAKKAAKTE